MTTKEEVLKELPLRRHKEKVVTFAEFLELERMVKSFMLGQDGLEFLRKEIVARRDKFGLKAGMQHPPKTAQW